MPFVCPICHQQAEAAVLVAHTAHCEWIADQNEAIEHLLTKLMYAQQGPSQGAKAAISVVHWLVEHDARFTDAKIKCPKTIQTLRTHWQKRMLDFGLTGARSANIRYHRTELQMNQHPIVYLDLKEEITSLLIDPTICQFDVDDSAYRFQMAPTAAGDTFGEMFNTEAETEMALLAGQRALQMHPEYADGNFVVIPVGIVPSSDGSLLDKLGNVQVELTHISLSNIPSTIRGSADAWRLHSAMQLPTTASIAAANPQAGTVAGRASYTASEEVSLEAQRVRQEAMRIGLYELILENEGGFPLADAVVPPALRLMYPGMTIIIVPFLAALLCDLLGRNSDLCLKANAATKFETPFDQLSAVLPYSDDAAQVEAQFGPSRDPAVYNEHYLRLHDTTVPWQARRTSGLFLAAHGLRLVYPWVMMLQHLVAPLPRGIYDLVGK
jgi:hypothetical protein